MLSLQQVKEHLVHMCPAADVTEASVVEPTFVGAAIHVGSVIFIVYPQSIFGHADDTSWNIDTLDEFSGECDVDSFNTPEECVGYIVTKYLGMLPDA